MEGGGAFIFLVKVMLELLVGIIGMAEGGVQSAKMKFEGLIPAFEVRMSIR